MTRPTDDDRFNLEVLKLMLQMAWSDERLDPREAVTLLGVARSWGIPESELATLQRNLESNEAPPAPDLALLRDRPDEVFEALRALVASDGRVDAAEEALLEELRIILSSES
jgi:tellurite resistance protein